MKLRKFSVFALVIIAAISVLSFPVSANSLFEPNKNYTYWLGYNDKTLVYSKTMYEVEKVISGSELGYDNFGKPTCVCTAANGDIYILEESVSRITVLNSEYKVKSVITSVKSQDGNEYEFTGAGGLYVTDDAIYIADTANARIIISDKNGFVKSISEVPQSSLIPSDFIYTPSKVAVDKKGYMYVLSTGSTYGALLFKPDGEFQGFYGSNKVKTSVSGVLQTLWNNWFASDEQMAGKVQKIPFQFTDICIDSADFVYTVTGATDITELEQTAQIRRLSPAGNNTLTVKQTEKYANTDTFNFGDEEIATNSVGTGYRLQNFTSIAVDESGYIYALDSTYGRVYIYDSDCNLLTALGGGAGAGEQIGTFKNANYIAVFKDRIFVTDYTANTVTVFKRNEYGNLVVNADNLRLSGKHTDAEKYWQEIIKQDPNNQLAYRGLAKASLIKQDYDNALDYAKKGLDYASYNQAYSHVRNDKLKNSFGIALIIIIIVAVGISLTTVYLKKSGKKLSVNPKLRVMLRSVFHPFESMNAVKYSNGGSIALASIILVLFYIFKVCSVTHGGFLHTRFDSQTYNSIFTLLGSIGVVLLWSICNWGMSVLFSGKCRFKETYIVSSYAMIPQIVNGLFYLIFSNVLLSEEAVILSAFSLIMMILSGIVLCVGTMVINEFDFFKFVLISIVTLLAMGVIIFVIFMVMTLDNQLITFIQSIFKEIWYR